MNPRLVNVCERLPDDGNEKNVIVVGPEYDRKWDLEYAIAKYISGRWIFNDTPDYTRVVAWIEASHLLSDADARAVAKDNVRL